MFYLLRIRWTVISEQNIRWNITFRMHWSRRKVESYHTQPPGTPNYESFFSNLYTKIKYNSWSKVWVDLVESRKTFWRISRVSRMQNKLNGVYFIAAWTALRKNHSVGSSTYKKRVWMLAAVKGQSGCSRSHKAVCFPCINWGSTDSVVALPRPGQGSPFTQSLLDREPDPITIIPKIEKEKERENISKKPKE